MCRKSTGIKSSKARKQETSTMPDEEVEASTSGGMADIVSECNDEEMHISTIRRKIEKM